MDKRIALAEPVEWFERKLTALTFAEPRGRHLMFGEPRTWITNADGAVYAVENTEVIRRYIDDLLKDETGAAISGGAIALFGLLSLPDALRVKDALFDFFTEARRAPD